MPSAWPYSCLAHAYHMPTTCPALSLPCIQTTAYLKHVCRVSYACLRHACHVSTACLPRVDGMPATCLRHACHMSTASMRPRYTLHITKPDACRIQASPDSIFGEFLGHANSAFSVGMPRKLPKIESARELIACPQHVMTDAHRTHA